MFFANFTQDQPQPNQFNPRKFIWGQQWKWPINPAGYVSLITATHRVGGVFYGDAWTGEEPTIEIESAIPSLVGMFTPTEELSRAHLLLWINDEEYSAEFDFFDTELDLREILTPRRWAKAYEQSLEIEQRGRAASDRFVTVQNWLARQFEAGSISTAIRANKGGRLWDIERTLWNTEYFINWFVGGQLDVTDPYCDRFVTDGGCWIFASETELNRILSQLIAAARRNVASPIDADVQHLSPYIQKMIAVSKAMNITPENQPKKAEVEVVIREMDGGTLNLSPTTVSEMAGLIRDPDSRKGSYKNKK